jgi:hypothetical protein
MSPILTRDHKRATLRTEGRMKTLGLLLLLLLLAAPAGADIWIDEIDENPATNAANRPLFGNQHGANLRHEAGRVGDEAPRQRLVARRRDPDRVPPGRQIERV